MDEKQKYYLRKRSWGLGTIVGALLGAFIAVMIVLILGGHSTKYLILWGVFGGLAGALYSFVGSFIISKSNKGGQKGDK